MGEHIYLGRTLTKHYECTTETPWKPHADAGVTVLMIGTSVAQNRTISHEFTIRITGFLTRSPNGTARILCTDTTHERTSLHEGATVGDQMMPQSNPSLTIHLNVQAYSSTLIIVLPYSIPYDRVCDVRDTTFTSISILRRDARNSMRKMSNGRLNTTLLHNLGDSRAYTLSTLLT